MLLSNLAKRNSPVSGFHKHVVQQKMGILINFYSSPPPSRKSSMFRTSYHLGLGKNPVKISKYPVWARPFLPIKKSSQLIKSIP
jgi:hypothetical protein